VKYSLSLARKVYLGNYQTYEVSLVMEFDTDFTPIPEGQKQITEHIKTWIRLLGAEWTPSQVTVRSCSP